MYIKLIQLKMDKRPMDTDIKTRMAPPLGLLTIANLLRGEHRVVIENENVEAIVYDDHPDIVGITVTVDTLPRAVEAARRFRAGGAAVVAGGIHISAAADTIPSGYFDALSIGPAEGSWREIVRDHGLGCLQPVYRCRRPFDGGDIVSPAYDMLPQGKYLYCNVVHTSRGCPFRCDFCYNSAEAHEYLRRPVAEVLKDIGTVGSKHIMFIDDNLIGDPAWAGELVRALKPLGIKWNGAVSANIVDHPALLDEMKASGCQSLFVGFESIQPASLRSVHKVQNDTGRYDALVEALHSRGIMINASFVFGLDSDTAETFALTRDWIVRHKIETVTSHILTPYPGTRLYERLRQDNRISTSDLSLYNTAHVVFHPLGMTAEELYEGYLWVYKEIYSLKNILRRMPEAREQRLPYLMFNLFYRKFGKFTDCLCKCVSYRCIGLWGEKLSRYLK